MARPSKYDPSYCEKVIEFLAQGYTIEAFAGEVSVAPSAVYRWQKEHPEFQESIKIGQAKGALVWERRLAAIATGKDGNATAVIFGLKNRHPAAWRDKQEVDHSGGVQISRITRTIVRPEAPEAERQAE